MRGVVRSWLAVVAIVLVPAAAQAQLPPTEFEQYQLELINRARANPNAEVTRLSGMPWGDNGLATADLNEGLASGTISSAAKQPLAFNANLIQAARNYSDTLLANDAFTHTYNSTSPTSRMTAAGYPFTGGWSNGENLAVSGSTGAWPITAARVEEHHNNLFIDDGVSGRGHRINLMNANWREVGIGISAAGGYDFFTTKNLNAIITTQDFAANGSPNNLPFITGVAYFDRDGNNFYTPGNSEALGGLTVTVFRANTSTQVGTTTTFGSGGYAVSVPTNDIYDVRFSGSGYNVLFEDVSVTSLNVKLDFTPVPEPAGLLALAGAALVATRWRRRRTSTARGGLANREPILETT